MNGSDQLVLFDKRYNNLAYATTLLACLFLLQALLRQGNIRNVQSARAPLELWVLFVFAASIVPELWQFPQYTMPFSYAVSRLTSISAILGICVLGSVTPKLWHVVGLGACAAVFFVWTFQDTAKLNEMERRTEFMVSTLPYGRRVIATIDSPDTSRINSVNHIVDRACLGKCFSYSNYEPASRMFRVRAHDSPMVTDSVEDSMNMQDGIYVVKERDLPTNQIYQCDERDFTKLCMRELSAGKENGRSRNEP